MIAPGPTLLGMVDWAYLPGRDGRRSTWLGYAVKKVGAQEWEVTACAAVERTERGQIAICVLKRERAPLMRKPPTIRQRVGLWWSKQVAAVMAIQMAHVASLMRLEKR